MYAFTGAKGDYLPLAGLTKMGTTYYSTTEGLPGAVYSITPAGVENVFYTFKGGRDGCAPFAGLTKLRHKLYGTTAGGGGKGCLGFYGCGTVYSILP